MADQEYKHVSQNLDLFDDTGSFNMPESLEKALSLWKDINKEQENYHTEQEKSALALDAILNDRQKELEAQWAKELKYKKDILKLELKINDAISKGDKEHAKSLEKALKLVNQTKQIDEQTNALKEQYGDLIDAAADKERARSELREMQKKTITEGLKSGDWNMIKSGLSGGLDGAAGALKSADTIISGLANFVKGLDKYIQEIGDYKSKWDTRLYGSDKSHWSTTTAIQFSLGASPYVKQSEVLKSIDKAVQTGIAYNLEQRAFLDSISDKIAGTFDAFDSNLLQIVRVQQSDSTAARAGMEAFLNEYLNKTFKTTEYLSNAADNVTGALYEATSLLSSTQSIGFEYQVQKWLGSLYSVGMSNSAVSSIAQALGQLASGDISGTSSGAGKLLVMSASRAGLSYSDLLTKGINDSQINALMENMVEYLKTIADSNKVVQTQLAAVYGLRTSDIQAASNLSGTDITNIYGSSLDYGGSINMLNKMARTVMLRTSTGEMMNNLIDNFKFTLATGVANNPALYALWTISNMLDEMVGGIPIPSIGAFAMGNGIDIDLETTVADLMRVGAMSGGLFSGIGSIVSGLATNALGLQGVLAALGVRNSPSAISRGSSLTAGVGQTSSGVSYLGNTQGSDVLDSSTASADDQKNQLAVEAQQDQQQEDIKLEDVNNTLIKIYDLMESVIIGGKVSVRMGDDFNFSSGATGFGY